MATLPHLGSALPPPRAANPPPSPGFPTDLRWWLDEDHLLRSAIEHAALRAGSVAGPRTFRHGNQSFPAAQLLALLAFAYLSGRLGSEEIEAEIEVDEMLRYLCAGRFPSSAVLRQFRRVHRETLGLVLQDLLGLALRERATRPWHSFPARVVETAVGVADSRAKHPLDLSRKEAESRLARAVQADMMALDV